MRPVAQPVASSTILAVSRINGSLTGPGQFVRRRRLSVTWNALWRKVSVRQAVAGMWAGASGALFVRGLVNASDPETYAGAPPPNAPRICVLGGGFGGLYTAVKLEGLLWPQGKKPIVTLIDQADRFTFKPLLYELLTGAATAEEVAPLYSQVLSPYPIHFVQGRVASVVPESVTDEGGSDGGGSVILASGEVLPYDWLVLALGAETNTFGIPGVKEHALRFSTYGDAIRVTERLNSLANSTVPPEVVIVGGGYAGVELAAAVSDRFRGHGRIKLITATPDILEGSPQGQREAARKALEDDGIAILSSSIVKEVRLAASKDSNGSNHVNTGKDERKRLIFLQDDQGQSEILEADIVLWAAGQAPTPKLDASSLSLPFPSTPKGATQTDSTLRVLRNRCVFALGDVAVADGNKQIGYPATAQVALQQADYVAWNIWASVNNRPLLKFSYQHLGEMMSLGTTRGAVSLPLPVPPPIRSLAEAGPVGELLKAAGVKLSTTYAGASDGVTLEGPLAAALRRVAYLYRQPTDQQRFRVAASWASQTGAQAARLARQILAGNLSSTTSSGE